MKHTAHAMNPQLQQFALCLENTGNEASLVLGKVYPSFPTRRQRKTSSFASSTKAVRTTCSPATNSPLSIFPNPCAEKFSPS